MTTPAEDQPPDATDEQQAAELAQYDEALPTAAAVPIPEAGSKALPPAALRRLQRAQAR